MDNIVNLRETEKKDFEAEKSRKTPPLPSYHKELKSTKRAFKAFVQASAGFSLRNKGGKQCLKSLVQ